MKEAIQNDYDNVKSAFGQICTILGKAIELDKIQIIVHGNPHKPERLPKKSIGLYMFK